MHFILKDEPEVRFINAWKVIELWKVIRVKPQPSVIVAQFVGGEDENYIPRDLAPLLAGDYVEFLNEKYLDKEMNAEWPPMDKEQHLAYHLERVKELTKQLEEEKWD